MSRQALSEIDTALLDFTQWPTVDLEALPPEKRARVIRYRDAIIALISGMPRHQVTKTHRVSRNGLNRMFRRCLKIHRDGRIWGFRALLGYARQNKYTRQWSDPKNASSKVPTGKFCQLLERYPAIKTMVDGLFLKKAEHLTVHESRIPIKSLHLSFLSELRKVGLTEKDYPFDQTFCGYRAMGGYLKTLFKDNLARSVRVRVSTEAGRLLKNGVVAEPTEAPRYPMQRVLADGHHADIFAIIYIQAPTGETVPVTLERFWVFLLLDEASRAVLGYQLCLSREYNEEDVLQAIEHALVPWKPKELTIPGLEYKAGAGLPNGVIPQMDHATWAEFCVDNAKANLSNLAREKIVEVCGGSLNPGPVAMPERRAIIERFFGSFERNGFQRLPSTSGNGPKDVRRKKPEEAAVELEITLSEMEQLLDVIIANYNCEPHSALHGRTPLEYLRHYIADNGHIPQIPEAKRSTLGLLDRRIRRTVRGSIKAGKRPHITFAGVTYHNEVLARSPDLIGKNINIIVRLRDARSVHAFFPDGNDLGVLVAQGHWGVAPHDYRTRRAITKLRNKGLLKYFEGSDPIKVYMEYLETKSRKHKSARLPLAKIRRHKKNAGPAPKASDGIPTVEVAAGQNESDTPTVAAQVAVMNTPRKTVVY